MARDLGVNVIPAGSQDQSPFSGLDVDDVNPIPEAHHEQPLDVRFDEFVNPLHGVLFVQRVSNSGCW